MSAERAELEQVRAALAREARALAQPRIWPDTIGAVARTVWLGTASFAPDTPLLLLGAANAASGVRVGPVDLDAGALRATERLVRRGGPAYIKLGQFIASGEGMMPPAWVSAFSWCRDDAPRIPFRQVRSILRREVGLGSFAAIDSKPLAAGSIAQVHRATLVDGTPVVVKVRRPGVARRLRSEIGGLALAAAAAERFKKGLAAANLPGFVELFAQLALEESDFRLEALNLSECASIFAASGMEYVVVPKPYQDLVSERVLVSDYIDGIPYDRAAAHFGKRIDGERMVALAIAGVLRSALVHGLFHGDLHAGNVLVRADGTFGLIDFGICGRFTPAQRESMVGYLIGFAQQDAHAQTVALQEFGALADASDRLLEELACELDRIGRRADGAITFERLGESVSAQLAILARNGFRMPKELVLFFKNLLYLSSFAAALAPGADLFSAIEAALGSLADEHGAELTKLAAAGSS